MAQTEFWITEEEIIFNVPLACSCALKLSDNYQCEIKKVVQNNILIPIC